MSHKPTRTLTIHYVKETAHEEVHVRADTKYKLNY